MESGPGGRVPPHDDDAERAALGAMLIDAAAVAVVRQKARPEDFYTTAHRRVYEAILSLTGGGYKADLLTIKGELERTGKLDEAGGLDYVASLTNIVPSSANADYYAQIIQDCSLRRGLIQVAGYAGGRAYDETTDSRLLLEETQKRLFELINARGEFKYKKADQSVNDTFQYLERVYNSKAEYTGIPSGFEALDRLTAGFQRAELVIIGARPGMGKTAIALNMASHVALRLKLPVAYFSLEMSDQALMLRLISAEARIDSNKLRTGYFDQTDFPKIWDATGEIHQAPFFIVDMPGMTILDIQAMARLLRQQEKVEIIFIDYLGLIGSDNPRLQRFEFISEVSRALKGLARELDIPVVALVQLRREAEKEKPSLADIRESGSIEQDADMVMFINRDRELDKTAEEQSREAGQKVQLILAKNRNGQVGTINLAFLKQYTRFAPLAEEEYH